MEENDILEKQLVRIGELKQRVLDSGYHPVQLDNIVREVVNDSSFKTITFGESCQLIDTLEYYCDFAVRCKKINCSK